MTRLTRIQSSLQFEALAILRCCSPSIWSSVQCVVNRGRMAQELNVGVNIQTINSSTVIKLYDKTCCI